MTIERYYERADIVMVGRIRSVRTVADRSGAARLEVVMAPIFQPEPTLKGSLGGRTLATPVGSASCGVEVAVGRDFVIFASAGDPSHPQLAWFDSCSGSRRLPAPNDPDPPPPFAGLANNRVVPRLFELAMGEQVQASGSGAFHTSPACWDGPRIYHQGSPPADLRGRIRLSGDPTTLPDSAGIRSPNGAYRAWARRAPLPTDSARVEVLVDVERPRPLRLLVAGLGEPPVPQWVSEKLLFIRVVWGRVQFSDVILDVEQARLIYEEAAGYGANAFEQFREACLGQCPCAAVPGKTDSSSAAPRPRPAPGQTTGLAPVIRGDMGYLDGDWDGRVFSEAGGRRFTVSRLKGGLGREEYPMRLVEARRVDGGWWLLVELFERSPCDDPPAGPWSGPAHRGWVPAFSTGGQLVASTWKSGC